MSGERAAAELGWRPTTPFAEGVRRYVDLAPRVRRARHPAGWTTAGRRRWRLARRAALGLAWARGDRGDDHRRRVARAGRSRPGPLRHVPRRAAAAAAARARRWVRAGSRAAAGPPAHGAVDRRGRLPRAGAWRRGRAGRTIGARARGAAGAAGRRRPPRAARLVGRRPLLPAWLGASASDAARLDALRDRLRRARPRAPARAVGRGRSRPSAGRRVR